MRKSPKVSICMITYNHENYIRQAIESVLMQECDFEIEFIVANDCSLDNTDNIINDILENYPKKSFVKYFNHQSNLGMMPNFIFAVQQCTGKYIALCEGDDYWTDPLKLQKQVDFLEMNSDYVLSFHEVDILKSNNEIVDDFITKVPENYENIEILARLGNYIHTPSVVFRNIIKEFPFEFKYSPIGDYFLYLMLAEHGKLKCLNEKMAIYRHGVGVFSGISKLKKAKSNHGTFTCLLSYLKDEKIKKIIFDRQKNDLDFIESLIRSEYEDVFVSRNLFFKTINSLMKDYKTPQKILKKIKAKII
ncbi:glycosyltransferase [Flavobacterium sp. GA093]|uniref:Glycosyltransferase n=1 Tax=Flavobacterium hydrocarbonoxydans TaxID=2683249 RepID=A0A6I4NKG4_9FLAO|nr:glycosyltransferase [Flavobacterium hydrocarbonoxydans]MWB94503.1 glycosyltransferase [Flavobacterium hydrocarbonoxydans]